MARRNVSSVGRRKGRAGRKSQSSRGCSVGCQPMSRGKFLKTAGVGAAALGATAVGMGSVVSAKKSEPQNVVSTINNGPTVYYVGGDWTTLGDWYYYDQNNVFQYNYGNCAFILGAMNATPIHKELPVPVNNDYRYYDVYGGLLFNCQEFDYKVYTCKSAPACDNRAIESPDGLTRRPTCYWSSNNQTIHLQPPPGFYQLALYFLDWDSNNTRALNLKVFDSGGPSQLTNVANFNGGKWVVYDVLVTQNSSLVIDMTKTAGANTVISAVCLDINANPPPQQWNGPLLKFIDTVTGGSWKTVYGDDWHLLCAYLALTQDNNTPEDMQYDVIGGNLNVTIVPPQNSNSAVHGGNYWGWEDSCNNNPLPCNVKEPDKEKAPSFAWSWGPDNSGFGLRVPPMQLNNNIWQWVPPPPVVYPDPPPAHLANSNAAAWASCYDDGGESGHPPGMPDLYVELTLPPGGGCSPTSCYHVSFYATDFDSSCRNQVIQVLDPTNGSLLAQTHDPNNDPNYGLIGNGVYHTFWMRPGMYLIKVDYIGCTNAILSGIFVDCVECPSGDGDFRTIGFWKHQFAVATGLKKGRQHVKTSDLLDYLSAIGGKTSLPALQGLDLNSAYEILWPKQPAHMCVRALQQLLALYLNWASGAATWTELVYDVDAGMNRPLYQIIADIEAYIQNGDKYDCEKAKTIADFINNSGYE